MRLSKKKHLMIRWTARILTAAIILFGLPFYFGYGNPLPFVNPDYSTLDNIWLTIFPLVFIGLGLGWKFERTGGYLVTVSIAIGFLLGFILKKDISVNMLIPFFIGLLYLFSGYQKDLN